MMDPPNNDNASLLPARGRVLALCGGVGGVKLALGLYRVLPAGHLVVAVNTGDDFEHLGLHISPDIDTVLYTLSGVGDRERGWGRANETWNMMSALRSLGGEDWFQLGDMDLATHLFRTDLLRKGATLSSVTAQLAQRLGIAAHIVPMTNEPVRTVVHSSTDRYAFQHYFVRERCQPRVSAVTFEGAESATVPPHLQELCTGVALDAIILCPSNPYLSIDPILAIQGIRRLLMKASAPVIAISPIVAGQAIKGPTAKIMSELGLVVSSKTVCDRYRDFIDGFVVDRAEPSADRPEGLPICVTNTIMTSLEDRDQLARDVLRFATELISSKRKKK